LAIWSCNTKTPKELEYIASVEKGRSEQDSIMQFSQNSPFNYKGKVEFHPLKYFEPTSEFIFFSKLLEYERKDTITIFGTKGEERSSIRFGYLNFSKDNINYKINVYENFSKNDEKYYSIWFTDKTTNNETYGVGRYLPFEKFEDPTYLYKIDFNLAFNPYCAYSSDYSCAIPSKEDYIDLAIEAGEKKFHD
jgi:uncharacterized protein (DUF1684 family)